MSTLTVKQLAKARERRGWAEIALAWLTVYPTASQGQLAAAAGTSLPTLNRLLNHLSPLDATDGDKARLQALLALPIEALAPGYSAPLPPPSALAIAEIKLEVAGVRFESLTGKLAQIELEHTHAKRELEAAHAELLKLSTGGKQPGDDQ